MTATRSPRPVRRVLGAVALTGLLLGAAACGGTDEEPDDTARTARDGSQFNDADVEFATQMIPHHAQAVEMVVLAEGRDVDPEIAALMTDIREAQVPEVQTMTEWLTTWGEPVPETGLDHANAGHDGGSHDMEDDEAMGEAMTGMMTSEEMQELREADDAEFEQLWLEMMTEHHEGAVEMAETEVAEGLHPDAVALAESVITSQSAEIEAMEELLG
ncbi:lipoprotein [Nocardioides sp. OK12]|uniref:DUF305 domain-containing protein n=1 Tax=Nocardioides sp. OK12 TaxID=2758661 RepID=UPI0021C2ABD3|nr:DUF305 domain-containing protein [Nocardioides sp. OK12]GHJ59791.1 lipoprotein [Nocardioides sp. OK12]